MIAFSFFRKEKRNFLFIMCAEKSGLANATASQNGNEPMNIEIAIDINDIYDGALKVLKRVKPFWPINNVKFKVRDD